MKINYDNFRSHIHYPGKRLCQKQTTHKNGPDPTDIVPYIKLNI
jgi:hypothetical protein